jgi:hypothetical protein
MPDGERAGAEPFWKLNAMVAQLDKVVIAFEQQGVVGGFNPQRHSDPAPDVFF